MKLTEVVEKLAIKTGIPEPKLWEASAELYPALTRNRARMSVKMRSEYCESVENKVRKEM